MSDVLSLLFASGEGDNLNGERNSKESAETCVSVLVAVDAD